MKDAKTLGWFPLKRNKTKHFKFGRNAPKLNTAKITQNCFPLFDSLGSLSILLAAAVSPGPSFKTARMEPSHFSLVLRIEDLAAHPFNFQSVLRGTAFFLLNKNL